jgi:hypothetical protein
MIMERLLILSLLTLNVVKGYSQSAEHSQLLNREVLDKVNSMMVADEGLTGIEDLYQEIANEPKVKNLILSYYAEPLNRAALTVKKNNAVKVYTSEKSMEFVHDFLPARAFMDSIPNPFFDPAIKRFSYEEEHAQFYYLYREFREAISQRMNDLGLPSHQAGVSAGGKIVEQLDSKFNFSRMELSDFRQGMIESSRNARNELAKWSAKSDHYAGTYEERRTVDSREASAYRISRAILIRMCDELEFGVNLSYFTARKQALGNMAAQAAKHYQNISAANPAAAMVEILEISKALLAKVKLMLFDGSVLQSKAQIINYNFNTLIDASRL